MKTQQTPCQSAKLPALLFLWGIFDILLAGNPGAVAIHSNQYSSSEKFKSATTCVPISARRENK